MNSRNRNRETQLPLLANVDMLASKRQHNELVKLLRLPLELIVHIFQYAQCGPYQLRRRERDVLDVFEIPGIRDYEWSWVHLMATCTRLREIALATPQLWRCVKASVRNHDSWAKICLKRARGLAPILELSDPSFSDATIETTKSRFCLAYQADVSTFDTRDVPSLNACLNQTCMRLKHLNLRSDLFTLTDRFLGGAAPNLTTLVLSVNLITSKHPNLPNLRHLKAILHPLCLHSQGKALMAWLNSTPKVEVLSLTLPSEGPGHTGIFITSVNLSNLRILHIDAPVTSSYELLCSLPEPSAGMSITVHEPARRFHSANARVMGMYTYILDRLTGFWNANCVARQQSTLFDTIMFLPGRTMPYVHACSAPVNEWTDRAAICRFTLPHHALATIQKRESLTTLHLIGESLGPLTRAKLHRSRTENSLQWFRDIADTHLDTLIIDQPETSPYPTHRLDAWLRGRKVDHNPIRLLKICDPVSVLIRTEINMCADELLEEEIVQAVEWM